MTPTVFGRKEKERFKRFKEGRFCSVYGCFNRPKKRRPFFSFPTHPQMREAWIKAANRKGFVPTEFSRVCSDHFREEDFMKNTHTGRMILKKWSIPTLFNEECVERPFPKYYNISRPLNMPETGVETNGEFVSFPNQKDFTLEDERMNVDPTPVKQEILSDEESNPPADASIDSIVQFFPLKELITQLRSKLPEPRPSITHEPALPVITDVRRVFKPDPDGQDRLSNDSDEDNFIASSFVDCQLGGDGEDDAGSSTVSNVRIKEYSSLQEDEIKSSGDEFELCDKCGSYMRKVDLATRRPPDVPKKKTKKGRPSCCCSDCPTCSTTCNGEGGNVPHRLSKVPVFQAYGEVLGKRLSRLPMHTSQLVQSVIEDLMFSAEEGEYDACTSKEGILKERQAATSVRQVGGFNGYDD